MSRVKMIRISRRSWMEFCTQLHPKRRSRSQRLSLTPAISIRNWLRGHDLNVRPSGYEPDELPDCSTPRSHLSGIIIERQTNVARRRVHLLGVRYLGE